MFSYPFELALRSVRRNVILTVLTVAATAIGIGVSMTVFTMLRALSSDPIPGKSSRLFVPIVDNWGVATRLEDTSLSELSYPDAIALMRAHRGMRQSAMYTVHSSVTAMTRGAKPFAVTGRAVYADFFDMFGVPFRAGSRWSNTDDDNRANVVVISSSLADRLFPRGDAVGQVIPLNFEDYRVVGVIRNWNPLPRFYDLTSAEAEDFFLPFPTAIDRQIEDAGNNACLDAPAPGWLGHLNSECIWIQFWVELPTATAAQSYREFLYNYASEQKNLGRFHWAPRVGLYDVSEWLKRQKAVPDEMRVATLIAFGFLLVCLLNSIGLMLAKFTAGSGEYGVRRALGASRAHIFGQCLAEAAVIGAVGGLLGLGLTVLGLRIERNIVADDLGQLTSLDFGMILITLSLAVTATIASGMFPAWRASNVNPAHELKAP
jgi:putative ABC transport system permease protein